MEQLGGQFCVDEPKTGLAPLPSDVGITLLTYRPYIFKSLTPRTFRLACSTLLQMNCLCCQYLLNFGH